jgi:hypothetical protein
MKSFYNIIDKIKTVVNAEPFNSTVTFGDISDIDLKKQSIFPLAHIMVNNATINDNYITFNVTLFVMDLVEVSKESDTSLFLGNDNTQDVLNTQIALGTRVIRVLQKADIYRDEFELVNPANCEPFEERFDNALAGWAITFDIGAKTEMTYC